mgnify:CR=1 FL=1
MNLLDIENRSNENKKLGKFNRFSARSALDNKHKYLWEKGADLFIPQINKLLNNEKYKMKIINIQEFKNINQEKLGELFNKYGSDKASKHDYYIIYSYILTKLGLNSELNILEIGLGTNNTKILSNMGKNAKPGASLRAFEDFLPKSNIYGADIDKNILFNENRIKTTYINQLDEKTFENVNNFGNIEYDIIIDDGLHSITANLNTLFFALNKVKKNGWIIIEDIYLIDNWNVVDFILSKNNEYEIFIVCNKKERYQFVVHKL